MNKIPIQCNEEQLEMIVTALYTQYLPQDIKKAFNLNFNFTHTAVDYAENINDIFERTDPPRWRAELSETYYYIDEYGYASAAEDIRNPIDDKRYTAHNFYE